VIELINIKKVERNLGIELLRMFLSYWIIVIHCLSLSDLRRKIERHNYHVPCFSFISFYFLYKILIMRNINVIKNRFERLLIPYFVWPSIIWIYNNISFIIFGTNRFERYLTFYDLKIQILVGRGFHGPMWFLFSLIIFTLFFVIVSFIFIEQFLFVLLLMAIISYSIQYSEYGFEFFNGFNECIRGSLGHCLATFPIAIIAILFSSFNLVQCIKKHYKKSIFLSFVMIYFIYKNDIFVNLHWYYGFKKAFMAILIFIFFASLPIREIDSKILNFIIKTITSYTQGIYCTHLIIMYYLVNLSSINEINFKECLVIYLLGYYISFIGFKIVGKTKLKYLFI